MMPRRPRRTQISITALSSLLVNVSKTNVSSCRRNNNSNSSSIHYKQSVRQQGSWVAAAAAIRQAKSKECCSSLSRKSIDSIKFKLSESSQLLSTTDFDYSKNSVICTCRQWRIKPLDRSRSKSMLAAVQQMEKASAPRKQCKPINGS